MHPDHPPLIDEIAAGDRLRAWTAIEEQLPLALEEMEIAGRMRITLPPRRSPLMQ
jgi:aspartokinase-like uncharacterized kinase